MTRRETTTGAAWDVVPVAEPEALLGAIRICICGIGAGAICGVVAAATGAWPVPLPPVA